MISIVKYILPTIISIIFGQICHHLAKKLPPVVSEEISYKEFFESLKKDFKVDIKYTIIFILLFNFLIYFNGESILTYLYFFVIFSLALVFSVDYRYELIPDECHIVIVLCSIINMIVDYKNILTYVLGALIGGLIFFLLGKLSLLIFKKEGMGFGDVKLMASLGFMFGVKNILVITLISFIFGAIIGGALLILKRKKSDSYIPFGPFIVIAAIIVMFVEADYIIELYFGLCSYIGIKMNDLIYFFINK